MKWYFCLVWLFAGGFIGFVLCALLTVSRIVELLDTVDILREYIRYLLHEEIDHVIH